MKISPHGKTWFLHAFIDRPGFARSIMNRFAGIAALAFLAMASTVTPTYAQSNAEGSILGRVVGSSTADLAGATATLSSKQYNVNRTVPVTPAGTFEFPGVAVG